MSRREDAVRRRVAAEAERLINKYTEGGGEEWFVDWEGIAGELGYLILAGALSPDDFPRSRAELEQYLHPRFLDDRDELDRPVEQYQPVATVVVRCGACQNRLDTFVRRRYGAIWSRSGNHSAANDGPAMVYRCKCGRRDIRVSPARMVNLLESATPGRKWVGGSEDGGWYQPANHTPLVLEA